jgi:hypothetical protein
MPQRLRSVAFRWMLAALALFVAALQLLGLQPSSEAIMASIVLLALAVLR